MYNQFYPYMMTGTLPNATRMASPLMSAVRTSPLSSLFGVRGAPAVSALGGATKASTFTFTGLLNGASKTLGVINQAIPVFYQIKPIINNAKTMYRVAKEINSNDKVLTPGRYVGVEDNNEDDIPFEEKMKSITTELSSQFEESHRLEEEIKKNLKAIGFDI